MTLGREDAPAPAPGRQGQGGWAAGLRVSGAMATRPLCPLFTRQALRAWPGETTSCAPRTEQIHPLPPCSQVKKEPETPVTDAFSVFPDNFPRQVHHVTNLGRWQERTTQPYKQGLGPLTVTHGSLPTTHPCGLSGAQRHH